MSSVETAISTYFNRMAEIHRSGSATGETSYYSTLENLLNEIGKGLDPSVICNGQLRNQGAGHPDFGLYSKKQCSRGEPKSGQGEIPERGVIEVKPLGEETAQTAQGNQTAKYLERYGLVLVTNYREFRLIGRDDQGKSIELESFALAADESAFWAMAEKPLKSTKEHGTHFGEFLQRAMKSAAPLTHPEDVAWFLASYARHALATLENKEEATLAPLRKELEIALGTKFEGDKGDHFFQSTLVQTLFYGVFSAWVMWIKDNNTGKFNWKEAGHYITVPMINALFDEVAKPSRLNFLGLTDILDRTGDALNRVVQDVFFKAFNTDEAVQHFYEPFLEAFDPELRKEMGVWYTPPEIVQYMVERVDRVLRTELEIHDGLADKDVYVLDPCCGTGTYVVEVLRRIEKTLKEKNNDALVGKDVKQAARERVFGFEIMSAPFVIAHWQVNNLLEGLSAPMNAKKKERPAIYLTNALTGWEPPEGAKEKLLFRELEQERDQAELVKNEAKILVVLGNPPYNAYAGTSPEEEGGLVEPYKKGLRERWGITSFKLDELYLRFLRVAERRIEATGRGLICYISSYSYLDDPQFVVARENWLKQFDCIWIDSMNGDSRETGKKTPTGEPDPSAFSTEKNKSGIKLGTAVGLFLKHSDPKQTTSVTYRDFWGKSKREDLLNSLSAKPFDASYNIADPQEWNRFSFRPRKVSPDYLTWPTLPNLADIEPFNGLMEKRKGALYDIDSDALSARMKTYFDDSIEWSALVMANHPLTKSAATHNPKEARKKALAESAFKDENIVRYIIRPFDVRHAYYINVSTIWSRARPQLWEQYSGGNKFLMSRLSAVATPEGVPTLFTNCLGDNDAQRGHSYYFPFHKRESGDGLLAGASSANLSAESRNWLTHLGAPDPDKDEDTAAAPWHHALAITYASKYLAENADGVAIDWPRVPLPNDHALFNASADYGAKIAALLDTENGVSGITEGSITDHMRVLGIISAPNLSVTAGWGYDNQGKVFPGQGKTEERDWTEAEKKALCKGFAAESIAEERGFDLLGRAIDVYLNDEACWQGVPEAVWGYYIGGYQVIKKWLSYREESILGREITSEEAREVTAMVRRLTAIILMSDVLDANYADCRDNAYDWPAG